ncbi:MAG: 6-bladed beta-propeller [Gemmatimonadaceae bacterium]
MTTVRRRYRSFVVGLVGITFASPWSASAAQATRQPPARTARLVLEIGEDMGGDEYTFSRLTRVAAARGGRIYALDMADKTVKVYDPSGKFLRAIGREGQGPGEFNAPAELRLDDSTLTVTDFMQRRASTFTLDGTHLRTRSFPSLANGEFINTVLEVRGGALLGISSVGASSGPGPVPQNRSYVHVTVHRPPTPHVDTLASIRSTVVTWYHARGFGVFESGFGDGGAWALAGDSLLAVVDGYTGAVRWFAFDGRGVHLVRSGSLGQRGRPVTPQDMAGIETRWRERYKKSDLAKAEVKFSGAPTHWSVATRAVLGDDGALWVGGPPSGAMPSGRTAVWSVFAPGATTPYPVALPADFTLTAVRAGRAYGYAQSDLDAPVVRVYELERR